VGDASWARRRIDESALAAEERALLTDFIERFRDRFFCALGSGILDALLQYRGISVPSWWSATLRAVFFAYPFDSTWIRFDGVGLSSHRDEYILSESFFWTCPFFVQYEFLSGQSGSSAILSEEEAFLDKKAGGVIKIAETSDARFSLGLKTKGSGAGRVVAFNLEDLYAAEHDGDSVEGALTEVFASYASMLSHVSHISSDG
jgi:hypothetical protein